LVLVKWGGKEIPAFAGMTIRVFAGMTIKWVSFF